MIIRRSGLRTNIALAVWVGAALATAVAGLVALSTVDRGLEISLGRSALTITSLHRELTADPAASASQVGDALRRVSSDPFRIYQVPVGTAVDAMTGLGPASTGSEAPLHAQCEGVTFPAVTPGDHVTTPCAGRLSAVVVTGGAVRADHTYLVVIQTLDESLRADNRDSLAATLVTVAVVSSSVAAMIAWWVSGWLIRPVRRAAAAAAAFGDGDLTRRLPAAGTDELGELSTRFNGMADRLQGLIMTQRRFIADTAHELRTPTAALVALAGALENPHTRDEASHMIPAQLRRLSTVIEDLLSLARFDEGREQLVLAEVDVTDVVRSAIADAVPEGATLVDPRPTPGFVDPARVRRIVRNLVLNAESYGHPPIEVTVQEDAGAITVQVRDGGPGVPDHIREGVFERFVRADGSRSTQGTGLGLAIAKEDARLHGGDLTLGDDGRTFTLTIPPQQSSEPRPARPSNGGVGDRVIGWALAFSLTAVAGALLGRSELPRQSWISGPLEWWGPRVGLVAVVSLCLVVVVKIVGERFVGPLVGSVLSLVGLGIAVGACVGLGQPALALVVATSSGVWWVGDVMWRYCIATRSP